MNYDFIFQRDLLTEYRKKRKAEFDRQINLSTRAERETVRLLDEGMVIDGSGAPWFYIKKGTLKNFYESLSSDFTGMITLAHFPFETFPFPLGYWQKSDLTLSVDADGFHHLDVDLNLDDESVFVKELRRQPFTVGVSAELKGHKNVKLSQKVGIRVLDEMDIPVFSVVGNAGNVNSSGINLFRR